MSKSDPIAIVGMSCLFPGSSSLREFWRATQEGHSCFRDVPANRWNHTRFYGTDRRGEKTYVRKIAYLDDIRSFNPEQYHMPQRRAYAMDPQQRLFLDQTRLALDDAGYRGRPLPKTTGVFVGASVSEYRDLVIGRIRAQQVFDGEWGRPPLLGAETAAEAVQKLASVQKYTVVGVLLNMIACNVSAAFDLQGPSSVTDAACSSSLVAIHEAVLHLRTGICDAAIVGGVYTICTPDVLVGFGRIGALSASDVCRPFDENADGFVLGEGAGVVVLKRLEDAQRDRDHIWAIVAGVGLSNDGRGEGPMTPRLSGQVDALARAYRDANIPPNTVGYIEAHGTATPVGDLTEVAALKENLKTNGEGAIRCAVSSVKGNIGHTLAASGIAGFIRAALAVNSGFIPPQAGLQSVRAELELEGSGFYIPAESQVFETRSGVARRAGVDAFGFGGTNVHVVLEESPTTPKNAMVTVSLTEDPQLFVISADTPALLTSHLADLADVVRRTTTSVQDIAYTLTAGRSVESARVAFVAASRTQLLTSLENSIAAISGKPCEGVFYAPAPLPKRQRSVAFLFPARGEFRPQHDLYVDRHFPGFRARTDALRQIMHSFDEVPSSNGKHRYIEGNGTMPCDEKLALVTTQLALVDLLADLDLRPQATMGQGLGEIVAARVGGILEERESLSLLARIRLTLNSYSSDELPDALQKAVAGLQVSAPCIPVISSFTTEPYLNDPKIIRKTLGDACAEDFDLHRGINTLRSVGTHVFVQLGSCCSSDGLGGETSPLGAVNAPDIISLLENEAQSSTSLLAAIGKLVVLGLPLNLSSLFPDSQIVSLPTSPVATRPYWTVSEPTNLENAGDRPSAAPASTTTAFPKLEDEDLSVEEKIVTVAAGTSAKEIQQTILKLISEVTGITAEKLEPDFHFGRDMGFDSITQFDFYTRLISAFPNARALPESLFFSPDTTIESLILAISNVVNGAAQTAHSGLVDTEALRDDTIPVTAKSGSSDSPDASVTVDAQSWCIEEFPEVKALQERFEALHRAGLESPYFSVHERVTNETSLINGREYVNFSSYNYLGLSGDPDVTAAAVEALNRYGTSVSASRLVSGEKPLHHELEREIAEFLGCQDAIAMVSGHATNINVIGHMFGPEDLVIYDSLAHDSIMAGIRLSGAKRHSFPHNNPDALDQILRRTRHTARRVLIAVEGVYSMDGDIAPLGQIVEIKRRHKALLLVDEAHSLGVLGETGRGIAEHSGVNRNDVELWMGTLSKSLASCGGYIAGTSDLVRYLKYSTPGFVYSVGIPPASAAAALAALRKLRESPSMVRTLQQRSKMFFDLCRKKGINTGLSEGTPIVPCILGSSSDCLRLSQAMAARGINVQPILHPAVEERLARLRFFVTSRHSEAQIVAATDALAEELKHINPSYLTKQPLSGQPSPNNRATVGRSSDAAVPSM